MLIFLKTFLYEVLHEVACSLLSELFHLVINLISSMPTCLAIFAPPLCAVA